MTDFTVKDIHTVSIDDYWRRVFFDESFTRELYMHALGFKRCEILSQTTHDDGRIQRKLHLEPDVKLPTAIERVLKGRMDYHEDGIWDPQDQRWRYQIVPSTMADKTKTDGAVWLEADPEDSAKSVRLCRVRVEVKIFGIGMLIEQFLEQSTRENLKKAGAFTDEWLRSHPL